MLPYLYIFLVLFKKFFRHFKPYLIIIHKYYINIIIKLNEYISVIFKSIPEKYRTFKHIIALLVIIIGLFISSILLHAEYGDMINYKYFKNKFYKFNIKDINILKEIFYSGAPSLFYCTNSPKVLDYNLYKQAKEFPKWLKLYYLNCNDSLPSGKSMYERFNLPEDTVLFISTRDKPPMPIPVETFDTFTNMKKFIVMNAKYSIKLVKKLEDFNNVCQYGKAEKCIVFFGRHRYINIYQSKVHDYIYNLYATHNFYELLPFIADSDKFTLDFGNGALLNKRGVHLEAVCVKYVITHSGKQRSLVRHLNNVDNFKNLKKFASHCNSPRDVELSFSDHQVFDFHPKLIKVT